jgi:hypothetical protein
MPVQTVPNQERGSINVYTCKTCNRVVVVKHVDAGVTPFMLSCKNPSGEFQGADGDCPGTLYSSCYPKVLPDDLPEPSYEVYRPQSGRWMMAALRNYDQRTHRAIVEHWKAGGALFRSIKKAGPDGR